MTATPAGAPTIAVVLCGGRGSRLGGVDKPLQLYRGRPLVEEVTARLAPQVDSLLISANRNLEQYARYGRVVSDRLPGYAGPLAGLDAALSVAHGERLVVCPGDAPDLPRDLVSRLLAALGDADAAVAHDGQRRQPLFLLLRCRCRADLAAYLDAGGRSAHGLLARLRVVEVRFEDPGAFRNLNEADDFTVQ